MGTICRVSSTLNAEDQEFDTLLKSYLTSKIFANPLNTELTESCYNALEDIFLSCFIADQKLNVECFPEHNASIPDSVISLRRQQILQQVEGNQMYTFFYGIKQTR